VWCEKHSSDPDLEIERLITAETSAGTLAETSSVWTRESQPVGGTQLSVIKGAAGGPLLGPA